MKMRCQISGGKADLSTAEPEPWSPCESSSDCSNLNFLTESKVLEVVSGSEVSSGDLRFLDAPPAGWLLSTGFEDAETAASARTVCV